MDLKDRSQVLDELEAVSEEHCTASSTVTTKASAAAPTLMGLPVELRLRIFAFIERGAMAIVKIGDTCAYLSKGPNLATLPALSRTCKQILTEAKEM